MQKERLPVAFRKACKRPRDVDPFDTWFGVALKVEGLGRAHEPEPARSADVATVIHDDGQEPRSDRHARAKLSQLPPRSGDGLLGGVLGLGAVPKHGVSSRNAGSTSGPMRASNAPSSPANANWCSDLPAPAVTNWATPLNTPFRAGLLRSPA